MTILEQALNKINSINKKQRDFFMLLTQGLVGITGKRTFRNLARYMGIDEHTFARQMSKVLDFVGINSCLIKQSQSNDDILIAAQDATFVSKSGKKTPGRGWFWNGSNAKSEKGLEVDTIVVVKVNDKKAPYTLSAKQTPASKTDETKVNKQKNGKKKKTNEPTRIDFYLEHLAGIIKAIIDLGIKYIAVDSLFAKEKYVNGAVKLGLHVISKFRKDVRLRSIYDGPQKARGRKKKFDDGKITSEDFKNFRTVKIDDVEVMLASCIAYSLALKRLVKVLLVRRQSESGEWGEAFLFSTDLELDDLLIYQFYVARFQIEFIFRDAKGFTGFSDCQSRDPQRMHYHFNASLVALNIIRLQDTHLQKDLGVNHSFSASNWNRQYHVQIVIDRFISMFGFDPTFIKSHPHYKSLLEFANVSH